MCGEKETLSTTWEGFVVLSLHLRLQKFSRLLMSMLTPCFCFVDVVGSLLLLDRVVVVAAVGVVVKVDVIGVLF